MLIIIWATYRHTYTTIIIVRFHVCFLQLHIQLCMGAIKGDPLRLRGGEKLVLL